MSDQDDRSDKPGFLATLSKMQSEIAVAFVLVMAAAGFTVAQLGVDVPFQWCPAGTVDRMECFRGWLVSSAGWIAALFAYLTIRQIRKQVERLEDEVEKNTAAERVSSLRAFREDMFAFHTLESHLYSEIREIAGAFDATGKVPADAQDRTTLSLTQLAGYDWSRLKDPEHLKSIGSQIDFFQFTLKKLAATPATDPSFIECAKHYLYWRDLFYEKVAEETGLQFDEAGREG